MGAGSPEPLPAAAEGVQTDDAGAVTPEPQSAAVEGGDAAAQDDSISQEGAEGVTEGKTHKKTLEERAAEIADRRIAEAEARWKAEREAQAASVPKFDSPEVEAQVERNIFAHETRMRDIEEQFRLDPQNLDPALVQEHRAIKRWIAEAENALELNRKRRQEWEVKQRASHQQQLVLGRMNADIAQATPIVRDSLGYSDEQWKSGEEWFKSQRSSNKLLDAEYRERCFREGPVRALQWAAGYVKDNMGKAAAAAKQGKEAGKDAAFSGGGEGGGSGFENIRSFTDLQALHSKKINEFARLHPKRFAELKARHFK